MWAGVMLAALAAQAAEPRFGNGWGYGPLLLRSQAPFHIVRPTLLPTGPLGISEGEVEVGMTVTWSNLWAYDSSGRYRIDAEVFRLGILLRVAALKWLSVEVEVAHEWRFGGVMDGGIENFHELVGLDQMGRDRFPRDDFEVEVEPQPGQVFRLDHSAGNNGLQDILVTARCRLVDGGGAVPEVSVGLAVTLPTASDLGLFGTPSADAGLFAALSWRPHARALIHANLGYSRFGSDTVLGIRLREAEWSAMAAFEYRVEPDISLVVQGLWNSEAAVSFRPFANSTVELTAGVKWRANPWMVLELAVLENAVTFDNSPDFGIHLGVVYRPPSR